jgi:hypothetical protein
LIEIEVKKNGLQCRKWKKNVEMENSLADFDVEMRRTMKWEQFCELVRVGAGLCRMVKISWSNGRRSR